MFVLLIACHFCRTMSANEDDGGARNIGLLAVPDPPDRSRWMSWMSWMSGGKRSAIWGVLVTMTSAFSSHEADCGLTSVYSCTCTHNCT